MGCKLMGPTWVGDVWVECISVVEVFSWPFSFTLKFLVGS